MCQMRNTWYLVINMDIIPHIISTNIKKDKYKQSKYTILTDKSFNFYNMWVLYFIFTADRQITEYVS